MEVVELEDVENGHATEFHAWRSNRFKYSICSSCFLLRNL